MEAGLASIRLEGKAVLSVESSSDSSAGAGVGKYASWLVRMGSGLQLVLAV